MRYKVFAIILAVSAIIIGSTVAMASPSGTTNEEASASTTIVVTTPDVVSAEAAIAQAVTDHVAEVERQQAEEQAAAAASAAARRSVSTDNYDPGTGSRWDQLAQCECGGNWGCNTGNGFGGGLQFMHQSGYSTWLSFGGGEFAPNPWDATREEQIVIAERVLASSGWGAWPGCSRKFGWL